MLRTLGTTLLCLAALAPIRAEANAHSVVVRRGDALITIAAREGVTVEQLKRWNGLRSDMIRIGQRLIVSERKSARPTTDDGIDWTPPFDYGAAESAKNQAMAPRPAAVAARDPSTAVAVGPARRAPNTSKTPGKTYRIQKGDTLIGIAQRHRTTVDELLRANEGLDPRRIYPGQTIDIGSPRPEIVFKLERGDTLGAAMRRYGVSSRDLSRWNRALHATHVRPGTSIRIYTRTPVSPSEAIGPTNRGRLENPVRLPPHRGYVIRSRGRAYGTEETVRWMLDAFDAVDRKFKRTTVVRVHDISDRDGGPMRGHKSHQNGRDADISYYQSNCGSHGCPFEDIKASELDVARQWALLEHWLRNGQAEMIFIDYRLQAKLYRYAKRKGATKAQLNRWLQYPRGKYEPRGVIRHFKNHRDHLHVRFVCPYSDLKCRP